jgi:hypothetical protein
VEARLMADVGPLPTVRRHAIVGLLGGLVLGVGGALLAVVYSFTALGTLPPVVIVLGATLLGGIWGQWGPVRTVGTPPRAGQPQADVRVREAMDQNVAAIDRAEQELRQAEAAGDDETDEDEEPVGPLPDIGPPGDGIWSGEADPATDPPADPPRDPTGPRAGSGEIGPQG